jgi:hypothetical protein
MHCQRAPGKFHQIYKHIIICRDGVANIFGNCYRVSPQVGKRGSVEVEHGFDGAKSFQNLALFQTSPNPSTIFNLSFYEFAKRLSPHSRPQYMYRATDQPLPLFSMPVNNG